MSETKILGDTRTVYEQLIIAITMAALTIALAAHQDPSWIDREKYLDLLDQGALVLDVRPSMVSNSASRALPGVTAIPASELAERLNEVPRDRPVIVVGLIGNDSQPSYELLLENGVDAFNLGPDTRFPRGHAGHSHSQGEEHGHEH